MSRKMRSHIISTLLNNFSNAKTIFSLVKDEIKVENQMFTIKRYTPVGTVMIHIEKEPQTFPDLLMLALASGNSIIFETRYGFLIDIVNFLRQINLPILVSDYNTTSNMNHIMGNRITQISVQNVNEYTLFPKRCQISLAPEELINLFSNKKYIYCTYGS